MAAWRPERARIATLALVVAAAALVPYLARRAPLGGLFAVAIGLLWLVVITAACAGLGWPVLRRLAGGSETSLEDWVVALAAGAGLLTAAAWLWSTLGLLRPLPLVATLVAAAVIGAIPLSRERARLLALLRSPTPLGVALLALAACTVLTALTLSPHYDQWHQHFGFPYQWLRHGHFSTLPRNFYSAMPANMSFLYTYGLAALGPAAAQLSHWWMGALSVAGVACLANRASGVTAGRWAVLVFAGTPTVMALSTTGLSDLGIAAWGAAAWLLVLRFGRLDGPSPIAPWALSGAFVGLAVGCKYVALSSVALPVGAAAALLLLVPGATAVERRAGLLRLLALAGGATATFGPWAARNLTATGNPLFPYFSGLFGKLTGRDQGTAEEVARWVGDLTLTWDHLRAGLDLAAFSSRGDGFSPTGCLYVVLIPVAAFLHLDRRVTRQERALALGGLLGLAAWMAGLQGARYLVGAFIPVAAVLGGTVARLLDSLARPPRAAVVSLLALLLAMNLTLALSPPGVLRLGVSLGQIPLDEVMGRWVSHWGALEVVNRDLPADACLLLVAEARGLLVDRDVELEHAIHVPLLVELAESSPDDGEMANALHRRGITHLLVNRHEARRMAAMAGRDDYFATSSPAASARLARFLATRLEPLWEEHGVGVYRLR